MNRVHRGSENGSHEALSVRWKSVAHCTQRRASMSRRRQFFGEEVGVVGRQDPLSNERRKSGLQLSHLRVKQGYIMGIKEEFLVCYVLYLIFDTLYLICYI